MPDDLVTATAKALAEAITDSGDREADVDSDGDILVSLNDDRGNIGFCIPRSAIVAILRAMESTLRMKLLGPDADAEEASFW